MAFRAKYTFTIKEQENLIELIDTGGPNDKSLTNDIENVLTDIHRAYQPIDTLKVRYRDSEGEWAKVVPTWWNDFCKNVTFLPD